MDAIQAIILGLVQGLTEYLPVSSSGHLAIASHLFGNVDAAENLTFTIVVHVATVLSTLVVLGPEILKIIGGTFDFRHGYNADQRYVVNILVSMLPIAVVGLFFKDTVEQFFGDGLLVVGCCLLLTAALIAFSYYARPRRRERISPLHAFIIGVAQALAVLPGLSRSGSTIATGLLLGNKKESMAQFSFLMVIPPILGEALLDGMKLLHGEETAALGWLPLALGFLAAFVSGCVACRWMIRLVARGRLVWFSLYCAVVGAFTLIAQYV